VGGC